MAKEPTDLVPVETARPPDAYERKYMAGDGTVLYRDKSRAPWALHAIFAAAAAVVIVTNLAAGSVVPLLIALPIMAVVWLFFVVLRVTVSTGVINIQYGLFGPKIPIAAVESSRPVTYDWKKFGGWGIKRSLDGTWIYNMPGDGGQAVEVVWRDAKGRRKVTLIGSRRSVELSQQIGRAQAALPPGAGAAGALPAGDGDPAS